MYTWKYIAIVDRLSQSSGKFNNEYILLSSDKWFKCLQTCKEDAKNNGLKFDYPSCWTVILRIIDENNVVYVE